MAKSGMYYVRKLSGWFFFLASKDGVGKHRSIGDAPLHPSEE